METLSLYVGDKIKTFRKERGMTQTDLAEKLGVSKQTISRYEKGTRKPDQDVLFLLSDIFNVSIDDFFPTVNTPQNQTDTQTDSIIQQLDQGRREKVLQYAITQLKEQHATIEEPQQTYQIKAVSALAAGHGFPYDDYDISTVTVANEPPRHDIASRVRGDSMLPDYEDGDVVYLVDKGFSRYDGEVCAVVVDDQTYIKKVYLEPGGLRLVSINPAYPDKFIDFPPSGDTHIKIYSVVGSDEIVKKA